MKDFFYKISLILIFLSCSFIVYAADPGHGASSIGTGTFESGNYSFPDTLEILRGLNVSNGLLYVDPATNNVGIGTTSPQLKLDLGKGTGNGVNSMLGWQYSSSHAASRTWGIGIDQSAYGDFAIKTSSAQNYTLDTVRLYIDASGNVGIGTTSPGTKLQITDEEVNTNNVLLSVGDALHATNTKDSWIKLFGSMATNDYTFAVGNKYGDLAITYLGTRATAPSAGTQMFTVQGSTGNVGIGTTAPLAGTKLEVVGTSGGEPGGNGYGGILQITTGTGGASDEKLEIGVVDGSSGYSWLQAIKAGTSTRPIVLNPLAGNVGIGTTNPMYKFVVSNAGAAGVEINPTGGAAGGPFILSHNRNTSAYTPLDFYTGVTPTMTLLTTGNVGIGTVSPGTKLSLGTTTENSADSKIAVFESGGTNFYGIGLAKGTLFGLGLYNGGSYTVAPPMFIDTSGNVGIGTVTVPHGGIGNARLAIEGGNAAYDNTGAGIQLTTSADDYPLLSVVPYTHDNVHIVFDGYLNTTGQWTSSDAGSNFKIGKGLAAADLFTIQYAAGVAQGSGITFATGISLTTTGNVGIGTTGPVKPLDVRTTLSGDQELIRVKMADAGGTAGLGVDAAGANYGASLFQGGNKVFTVESNYGLLIGTGYQGNDAPANGAIIQGNVGIGTTSPVEKLEVAGAVKSTSALVTASGAGAWMDFTSAGAGNGLRLGSFGPNATTVGTFNFYSAESDNGNGGIRMFIDTLGNVGIGTTTPAQKLNVVGDLNVTGTVYYHTLTAQSPIVLASADGRPSPICMKNSVGVWVGCLPDEFNVWVCSPNLECDRSVIEAEVRNVLMSQGFNGSEVDEKISRFMDMTRDERDVKNIKATAKGLGIELGDEFVGTLGNPQRMVSVENLSEGSVVSDNSSGISSPASLDIEENMTFTKEAVQQLNAEVALLREELAALKESLVNRTDSQNVTQNLEGSLANQTEYQNQTENLTFEN